MTRIFLHKMTLAVASLQMVCSRDEGCIKRRGLKDDNLHTVKRSIMPCFVQHHDTKYSSTHSTRGKRLISSTLQF